MAKRPRKSSIIQRSIATAKRNPYKAIALAVAIFGGLPTAVAGFELFDPIIPALHYYVREQLQPILMVQNTQARSIDRFLLYQQSEALAKAKSDPAAKSSPVVKERVQDLEQQVQDTEARIKKSAGAK